MIDAWRFTAELAGLSPRERIAALMLIEKTAGGLDRLLMFLIVASAALTGNLLALAPVWGVGCSFLTVILGAGRLALDPAGKALDAACLRAIEAYQLADEIERAEDRSA